MLQPSTVGENSCMICIAGLTAQGIMGFSRCPEVLMLDALIGHST